MTIQNAPVFYKMQYTNEKGHMTTDSVLYNDEMFQTLDAAVTLLNMFISEDGITFPNKTTVEITGLEPNAGIGTTWFNTTISKLQVKTAASVIETISSS